MQRIASLGLGKLAILSTLTSVLVVLVVFGQDMFSAGPLNGESRHPVGRGGVSSHAEIASCSACHAPAWSSETMANRCMNCHDNIRAQVDGGKAMHGLLAHKDDCMKCHTEHKGKLANLTSFAHFDHDCAAFKLTGKHRHVDCVSCHTGKTYQGTPQTCVACHAEPTVHKDRFGTDCLQCHTPSTWKAATIKAEALTSTRFNHDLTGFKLTGKHAVADCKSCHVNNSFKGTANSCVSCHAEPTVHKDRFGTDCMTCHSTNDWKLVALNNATFTAIKFDHATTGFPLVGKHKSADCKACHVSNTFKGTSQACVSCHAEPASHKPHPKSFGTNCAQCHNALAWKGATLVKHTFPMNHRTKNKKDSACAVCHPATINNNLTSTTPSLLSPSYATYTCYGCHHHTPEKEAKRHARRNVLNLNNCAFCHPTGRGTKRRAGLDETSPIALLASCREACDDAACLTGHVITSCPSADASDACASVCSESTARLRTLDSLAGAFKQIGGTIGLQTDAVQRSTRSVNGLSGLGPIVTPAPPIEFSIPTGFRPLDLRDPLGLNHLHGKGKLVY